MTRSLRPYLHASAAVGLVVEQPWSGRLVARLAQAPAPMTSRLSIVETLALVRSATDAAAAVADARAQLAGMVVIEVTDDVVERAAGLVGPLVGAPAAVHLASALVAGPAVLVAADAALLGAAAAIGLPAAAPSEL